jgi:hypothetical protein
MLHALLRPSTSRATHLVRLLPGIGHVAVRMHRQGYDLQLRQYERGWRAFNWAALHATRPAVCARRRAGVRPVVRLDSRQPFSTEVPMRRIGLVILALSLVLALRAVEAQQALRGLDDALADIRC